MVRPFARELLAGFRDGLKKLFFEKSGSVTMRLTGLSFRQSPPFSEFSSRPSDSSARNCSMESVQLLITAINLSYDFVLS